MQFQNPTMLLALLVVPPAVLGLVMLAFRRRQQFRALFGEQHLIEKNSRPPRRLWHWLRTGALVLGSAMVVLALSRPTVDSGSVEFPEGSTDVMVMVDVSRSMAALDYSGKVPAGSIGNGTRLDMSRYLLMEKIVPNLGANRLGIVTYAGEAFPLAFLSQDITAVDWMQKRVLTVGSAPGEGSHLVKAFNLAFRMFELDSKPGNTRVIILMSDGGNDDGLDELNGIIEELRKQDIAVVVIGLGKLTPSKIPIAELGPHDRARYYGQEYYIDKGEIATSKLDENVLRLFANRTGGKYIRVSDASDFSFDSLAQHLELKYRPGQKEMFVYPLMLGALLLVAGWLMQEEFTRFSWPWSTKNQRSTRR